MQVWPIRTVLQVNPASIRLTRSFPLVRHATRSTFTYSKTYVPKGGVAPCSQILSLSSRSVHNNTGGINNGSSYTNEGDSDRNSETKWRLSVLSVGLGWCVSMVMGMLYWNRSNRHTSWWTHQIDVAHCTMKEADGSGGNGSRASRFNFIAEAVEMAAPAVVYIEKMAAVNTIFGRQSIPSCGSGFIVDESGLVMTNAHVVHNSSNVTVKMSNGRTIQGTVEFIDQTTDLALIKMNLKKGETVPFLPFGDSTRLRSGEWVIAMGSPLSLSNTITAGIVSCVHRASSEMGLDYDKPDMEYVQTDAAITRGNSGGPLVNLDGQVIGINTMTAGPGISFAIPSDIAKAFIDDTKSNKNRKEKRYGIGVSMITIDANLLYQLQRRGHNLPQDVTHGVLLVEVWGGSPADNAGLAGGDIVVKVNGRNMKNSKELQAMVNKGREMEFEIIRNGRRREVTVVPTQFL